MLTIYKLRTIALYCVLTATALCSSQVVSASQQPTLANTAVATYDKLRAEADNSRAVADKARVEANHARENAVATYDNLRALANNARATAEKAHVDAIHAERNAGANYDSLRAQADISRATADKTRADANVAIVTQWTSWITAIATALLTILGLVVVAAALPRIISAARNGAVTFAIPLLGSISLAERNAAEQQKTGAPPPNAPEPIGTAQNPTATQLSAVTAFTQNLIEEKAPADIISAVQGRSSLLHRILPQIAGVTEHTDVYFNAFFRNLFLTQYQLLEDIVTHGSLTMLDARLRYTAARSLGLRALRFEDWVKYLWKYGMISRVNLSDSNAQLVATPRGKDFIKWSELTSHGEEQIRAANLCY